MIQVEYVNPDILKPALYNPRSITDEAMGRLVKLLDAHGIVDPLIARRSDNMLIGGHQRLKANSLRAKPDSLVPVVYLDVSDEQAKALNVALNNTKAMGEYDYSVLADLLQELDNGEIDVEAATGFAEKDIAELMHGLDEAVHEGEDVTPEPPETPINKTGDLWVMGEHRLLCGDSTSDSDVFVLMGDLTAECVFTSPPYAVGVDYGIYQDTLDNLKAMLAVFAKRWLNVISPGGYAVLNFGDIVSAGDIVGEKGPCEYPMALEYWPIFRGEGWVLWSRRIWCKPGAGTCSMQCISSNRAATNWEHVWTWKTPGAALHTKQTTGDYPSQNGWFDTTHLHKLEVGLKVHGAGMPVDVAMWGVATHSFIGGVVHEPFSGTGTTIIACEQLNRKCYAIEIEPRYVDVAVKRWQNYTKQDATLEGDGRTFNEIESERLAV
jgi:DNA modification methylase